MRSIELVLKQATGLRRVYRRHNIQFGYVDFVLSPRSFGPGAMGLVMAYAEDEFWGPRLQAYPADKEALTGDVERRPVTVGSRVGQC